jgi:tricorn protease
MKPLFLLILLTALSLISFAQTESPSLLQKPTISRTHIAFVYASDLWIVPREGGDAKRLTSGVGTETDPQFSPDGNTIAFTGEYDGNVDVFTVPTNGGVPKRVTFHPGADLVIGWTSDGKQILFSSSRNSYAGFPRLFTVSPDGGFPAEVPLPMAERGSFSPDGSQIAYEPLRQWQADWKRYRGGQQDVIWIAKLSDSSIERVPRQSSNDKAPMWIGDKVYFLSDRNGPVTLFAYDTKTKQVTQTLPNTGLDIKSASAFTTMDKNTVTGVIAYEQFGSINLLDLKTNKTNKVNIRVSGDFPAVRPRYEKVGTRITNFAVSPTGARAVFEARGEIITVPAEKGDPRNLTNTPGVMERDPSWSPDGKWVTYFSDESGEYALHLRNQSGLGEVKKISLPPGFYSGPLWSPDSKKIAFNDHKVALWYLEIDKGSPVRVDANPVGLKNDVIDPVWSPDSKWITYGKQLPNLQRAVFAYSLDTNKALQLTDGMSDARYPTFDKSGKYLYFTASTNMGPTLGFLDMSAYPFTPTRSVYAIVLRNDAPSPLAPESDEEKIAEGDGATGRTGDGATPPASAPAGGRPGAPKPPEPVRIDIEDIDQRIIALPIPARDFRRLIAGKANNLYILEAAQGGGGFGPFGFGSTLHKFDLEKRKLDKVMDGVGAFEISANGEKALYRQGANWFIKPVAALGTPGAMPAGLAAAAGLAPGGGPLKVADMEVMVDPRAEWKQMYHEVFRGERDNFYDPNIHGLDLKAQEKKYEPYLQSLAHRDDLNYLFREMLNDITIGHMYIQGGDTPDPKRVAGGLLGCDYKIENGRYRFARVYNGENWNPNLRAPLTQPGVNVKAGEYLLAINGRNLTANDNVYQALESTAGKNVLIRVGPNPDGAGSREVTIVPVASELPLRNLAWIEDNRRKVAQMSGGKLAYVYLPNTGQPGYENFNRYYFSQTDKDGVVIDERFNGGGSAADYMVQMMSRVPLNGIWFRHGQQDLTTPAGAIFGPKAMITNELAGSGGDALPWYFKKLKLGPTIGKRTWGGLVASARMPVLMDGGSITAPNGALYGLNGQWEVENSGIPVDIEVEFDPALWRQGKDPQLEKSVEYLMEELKKNPRPKYQRPPFPNYHTKGVAATEPKTNN